MPPKAAASAKSKETKPDKPTPKAGQVKVTQAYDAPPEKLFSAWFDKDNVGKWLFASPKGKMTRVEMNPRIGGGYVMVDQRPDKEVKHMGKYILIDKPSKIVMTMARNQYSDADTRIEIEIAPKGKGSVLTLTQRGIKTEAVGVVLRGWVSILKKLGETLGQKPKK